MKLNNNQKLAAEYLDGPLLVLAGPGTGKTQLLSQRVKYILEATDASPEDILCLTFTETGAENMRDRLKTIIGVREAAKININTYHAFGSNILAQYRNYNENYGRRLDFPLDDVTKIKILRKIQDALPGTDILKGDKIKDIKDTISDAKKARLTSKDLLEIATQNTEDSAKLSTKISPLLKNIINKKYQESLDMAYAPIMELLKNFSKNETILPNISRTFVVLRDSLEKALENAANKHSIAPLSDWKKKNFEQDKNGNYRLSDRIANKKLASFAHVMEQYEEYLRTNALFDYDDMIEEAVQALENDTGFRMTLQERYQYIMLDEFQDTNPSQFAIVKALTDYECPIIMAVGDDDQAIYEFQGALSTNMKDFLDYYHAKMIPLVENYRSTQEILDFASQIIAEAPDKKFGVKKLHANNPAPSKTQIHRYEFGASDAEYGFIANKINELIENGVNQNQIAVLTRKNKYFEPLLSYLKDYSNIKISYDKRDNLFDDEKVHEILTISQFAWEIANEKKPTTQIMEILTYQCFEASPLEIVKLNAAAKQEHRATLEYLAENGSAPIKNAINFLVDIATRSFTEPLENLLFDIAAKIESKTIGNYDRFCFYENLASLKGKLTNHFGDKKLKLSDLIEMVKDYEEAEMPLNTTSPYKDADEAVKLMTVHGAKGLEFEYVFIISADDKAWGKGKGNNNFLALPKNLQQIRHTGITDSERLRIMYVALTRAKHTLIITNSVRNFSGAAPARLEYFKECIKEDEAGHKWIEAPLIPSRRVEQIALTENLSIRENNVKNWVKAHFVENPDMQALFKKQMAKFVIHATALTTFTDIIYSGPKSFYDNYILKVQPEPESWQVVFGNLIHKTLEEVTKTQMSDTETAEFYLSELTKYDTTIENQKIVRERGLESLAATLSKFGKIIRSGKAEVNFNTGENITVNDVPIRGKIDHIVIDDKNKTIEIYDYKTGKYREEKWTSQPSSFKYALQLEFYKLLLNNSREYKNYQVTKGHILFVDKDDDGEVHDKVYEYGPKIQFTNHNKVEYEFKFVDLLKTVYQQITSLDFINDPDLFIDTDKNRSMKQEKAFIELLLAKNKS